MRWLRWLGTLLVLAAGATALVLVLSGTGEEDSNPTARGHLRDPERVRARAARRPAAPRPSRTVVRLAARLPLERRVAQLFLVGFDGTAVTAPVFGQIARLGWGGIVLGRGNYETPDQLASLAGEAAVVATASKQVRPLVAAAQEGGEASAFRDLPPAAQPELGAQGAAAVRAAAKAAAARLRELGFTFVIAPTADIGFSAGPADGRAFSDDPAKVARLTRAAVDGWRAGGVLPAVGHFPGQGAASQDPLDGPASVGLGVAEIERFDLAPFKAVADRAPVMLMSSAAFAAYDSVTPAALTPAIVRKLLRSEVGFTGVAMSDDLNGVAAATGTTVADAAVAALDAGIDLLYVPDPAEALAAYEAVLSAIRDGKIAPGRVRQALGRLLELKREHGLL